MLCIFTLRRQKKTCFFPHGNRQTNWGTGERTVGFQSAQKNTSFEMLRNHQKLRSIPSKIREYEGYTGIFFWGIFGIFTIGAATRHSDLDRKGKFLGEVRGRDLLQWFDGQRLSKCYYFLVDLTQQHPG